MSALIEVRELRKDFRREGSILHAVDGVDLLLEKGEAVGIIGESGSGKSTLARCVTKLEEPTSGRIFYDGTDITGHSDRALGQFRRHVQPVFQDPMTALNPRWSVRRLILEPMHIHREPHSEQRLVELIEQVGLRKEHLLRRPMELSGGERQRVAIARAIALHPSVLVLDEPTASIDMSMRRSLLALLKRLQDEEHLTYLYISHDIRTVEQTCSRTLVMYRGKVVEEGSTPDVLNRPSDSYTRKLMASVPRVGFAVAGSVSRSGGGPNDG